MITKICHKCKEYITIGDSYSAQRRLKAFDNDHKTHPLNTENVVDLPGYTNVNKKYDLLLQY